VNVNIKLFDKKGIVWVIRIGEIQEVEKLDTRLILDILSRKRILARPRLFLIECLRSSILQRERIESLIKQLVNRIQLSLIVD